MTLNSFDIAARLDEVTGEHFTPAERAEFDASIHNGLTRPAIEVALHVIIREPTLLHGDVDRALLRWLDGFSGGEHYQLLRLIRGAEGAWYGMAYGYVDRLNAIIDDYVDPGRRREIAHHVTYGYPHIAIESGLEVVPLTDCPALPADLAHDIRAWIARFFLDRDDEGQRLVERLDLAAARGTAQ